MDDVLFSHKSDNWSTPPIIYDFFMNRGAFDPCPLDPNGVDGLFKDWNGPLVFVNPPYSDINRFVDAAIVRHSYGKCIVMLLPSRTGTQWFNKLARFGCLFFFVVGRLAFGDGKGRAPFDSVFCVLNGSGISTMKSGAVASFLLLMDDYLRANDGKAVC